MRAPGGRGEGRGGSGGSHVVVSLCVSPSVLRWFGGGGGGEGGGGVGGREVGGERRYCRHRRRRRGGRVRATPPCAQRSVSPAEAARPQQPRKSVRACPLSPRSGAAGAGSPGFVCRPRREQPAGGRRTGPAGRRGWLRPGARSHNAGGGVPEGGVRRARRDLGFRASFLPPHRSLAALRAAGGPPGCLVSPRLGLETELSVRPALGFGKRGEAGWVQRRVRAGSGRRGRSGFLKTSVGIVQGPSVSRKSLR